MNPQWIFFDIGSTLVDEQEAYNHRAKEMLCDTSISFQEFDVKRVEFAKQGLEGNEEAIRYFGLHKTPWHSEDESPFPYTFDTLQDLKGKGYALGIIANQINGTTDRLSQWKLRDFFSIIASSDIVGSAKPNKAIFEYALTTASCKPENALMVGDRMDNDILPAKQIGMQTAWVVGNYIHEIPKAIKTYADFMIPTIADLKCIF